MIKYGWKGVIKLESKIPSYQSLMVPAVTAIQKLGGSSTDAQVTEEVIKALFLSVDMKREVHYRLGWSKYYLKKYGFIPNDVKRGNWKLKSKFMNLTSEDIKDMIKEARKK